MESGGRGEALRRGFTVNIAGFIVHRDVLLNIVGRCLGFLGVAFEIHKTGFLSSFTENDGQ